MNPLITITVSVRGAIHEQFINKLTNLKICNVTKNIDEYSNYMC